jgi:protein-disulfide isomerase
VKAPRESAKPSRTTTLVVLGVAVLATAALIVGALVLRGGGSSKDTSTTPAIDFAGIPQEGAVLGSQKAKVTLIEYADTQCPVCKAYTFDVLPTVVGEYVRPGKVKAEYRGYPFIGPDSLKAERFLLAAAEQNKLWQLMDAFYRNQGSENSGWVTDELIRRVASGIPGLDVDTLFQRAQSDELGRAAQQAALDAQKSGIQGTPTLFVKIGNGTPYQIQVSTPEQMRQALDDALSS